MRRIRWIIFVAALALLAGAPAAEAQKRVALVVGNSAYLHTRTLANPKNDATDMAAALRKHGFQVIEGLDLDKRAFDGKLLDFAVTLKGADTGLFFYAGHGLQVAGTNYLVPIDAKAEEAATLNLEMVRLDNVHQIMESQTETNVLFLDACRDNPLARNLARSMGTRSSEIGHGLAQVQAGVGSLISFSTQPGNVALDGMGRNSPFAGALVKRLAAPREDLSAILIDVRNEVIEATRNRQVPWEHSALKGRFYFGAPPGPLAAPLLRTSEATLEWSRVDKSSRAELETFRRRHPSSPEAEYALARIEELAKVAVAAPAITTVTNAALAPGRTFRDCDVCPEMVVVPAGSFTMGSPDTEEGHAAGEGPQRKVRISSPFAVGKYEVSFDEWDECGTANGCRSVAKQDAGWGRGSMPAIRITWFEAKAYVDWLARRTGKKYRMLSEAEWEYVARAGTGSPFWWGMWITPSKANYDGTQSYLGSPLAESRKRPLPVNTLDANPFGLKNILGNVAEWVEDCWHPNYDGAPMDRSAWTAGDCSSRIHRGGAWSVGPRALRAADRAWLTPDTRARDVGLRVAREFD